MIVAINPIAYVKERLSAWEKRLKTAENMPVGRAKGCWPSMADKKREMALCLGAIIALRDTLNGCEYATAGRPGTKRPRMKRTNHPEILPAVAEQ